MEKSEGFSTLVDIVEKVHPNCYYDAKEFVLKRKEKKDITYEKFRETMLTPIDGK